MSKFAPHRRGTNNARATPSTVCQRCLGTGHFTYQCKGERPYISRPSRTQQLEKPEIAEKLRRKLALDAPPPAQVQGTANKILEQNEKERERKRARSASRSGSGSSSSSSSSGSDSDSDSGSGSDSDSSSSESGSDSDSRSSRSRSRSRRSRSRSGDRSPTRKRARRSSRSPSR